MKVLCIDNSDWCDYLTKGKWYKLIENGESYHEVTNKDNFYWIKDDFGHKCRLGKERFKTQVELRENKLNGLGI